jgi:hypothetical protein
MSHFERGFYFGAVIMLSYQLAQIEHLLRTIAAK